MSSVSLGHMAQQGGSGSKRIPWGSVVKSPVGSSVAPGSPAESMVKNIVALKRQMKPSKKLQTRLSSGGSSGEEAHKSDVSPKASRSPVE